MVQSVLSKKTEIRETSLNGKGTFAIEDIKKGEMIYIRGGELMHMEEAWNYHPGECPDGIWPITDEYWLGARNEEDFKTQKVYVNHSCNPNCGMRGEITCVAMRDIKAGEEITQDYGLLDDSDYELECTCGAPNCRKVITGQDWKIKSLQDEFFDYFAEHLKAKIRNGGGVIKWKTLSLPKLRSAAALWIKSATLRPTTFAQAKRFSYEAAIC